MRQMPRDDDGARIWPAGQRGHHQIERVRKMVFGHGGIFGLMQGGRT